MICIKKLVLLILITILPIFGSMLTEDAASVDGSLRKLGVSDATIIDSASANFKFLTNAADTKSGHKFYRLISALLMTGQADAIRLHDLLLVHSLNCDNSLIGLLGLHFDRGLKLDAADKHMVSTRFKSDTLIRHSAGIELPDQLKDLATKWEHHQRPLMESLSSIQHATIRTSKTLREIISCVLIPDTLMMGMHPLQGSVSENESRAKIALNPRVQFVDYDWNRASQVTSLPPHLADDFKHRCFSLNYAPDEQDQRAKLSEFISNRDQQYSRIIFDWSTSCGVTIDTFIELSPLLREGCNIYTDLDDIHYIVDWKCKRGPSIFGKDKGNFMYMKYAIDYARRSALEPDHPDAWFLEHVKHPCDKTNSTAQSIYLHILQPPSKPSTSLMAPTAA